jgi:PleD family two-component response regulator
MCGILVDGETGAWRRQLEQHAARLTEVDAQEVLVVDDRCRARADLDQMLAPRLV